MPLSEQGMSTVSCKDTLVTDQPFMKIGHVMSRELQRRTRLLALAAMLLIPIIVLTGSWWPCIGAIGLVALLHFGFVEPAGRRIAIRVEALEHQQETDAANNRIKSDYLAHLSHEVRTPMTSILGYIELLEAGSNPAINQLEHLTTIRRNAEHLLSLLDCILERSKLEAGAVKPELVACRPAELLHDAAALLQLSAREKGITLELIFKSTPPESILTDPTRVKQILFNLIGNAIKFTEQGSVRVEVTTSTNQGPDQQRMIVEVIDTGIGIDSRELQHLFKPYAQATRTDGRQFKGTGLGLHISHQLAELLGGTLVASSRIGQGSRFRLEIPACEPGPGASVREDSPRLTGPMKRILLADDGIDSRRLLMFQLQRAGAHVEAVEDGPAACRATEDAASSGHPFDLILLDLNMPILDGFGTARRMRAQGFNGPILALSATLNPMIRNEGILAGFDAMAAKPISSRALVELCESHLSNRQVNATAA